MFGKDKKDKENKGKQKAAVMPSDPPRNTGVSRLFILLSILYVIIGFVMILWKGATVYLLGIVVGVGLLGIGLARIIIYLTRDHYNGIIHMDLTVGVMIGSLGGFMLLHKDFVETVFPYAIAILLLSGGISKLQYALDMKRLGVVHWNIFLYFAIGILAMGILLIYNPFRGIGLLWAVGISLIVEGVLNITDILIISTRLKDVGMNLYVSEESAAEMMQRAAAQKGRGNASRALPGNERRDVIDTDLNH